MDELEQSDVEKETNDSHNTCYQNAIHYAFARLKQCPSSARFKFLGGEGVAGSEDIACATLPTTLFDFQGTV